MYFLVSSFSCRTSKVVRLFCKHLTVQQCHKKSFYVTTPIFYLNAPPHVGHLYTATLADACCRWRRLRHGKNVRLVTGTDEHGSKVSTAAVQHGLPPHDYCNKLAQRYKDMCKTFNINYHDFIRTTEQRHLLAVKHFWKTLSDNDYIYKGEYEGWYSTSDEAFVPASEVVQVSERSYVHNETNNPVEWTTEVNYKFRLSMFKERIAEWIHQNPSVIEPDSARQFVLAALESSCSDLSVSRESSRVPWGIPVPDDSSQTIYVWLDALANYLTAAGYPDLSDGFHAMWPADVHIVGVDIIKFHAIFWPAFLMAAGLELPKKILVHSHWTVDNVKMSKSKGNIIDPMKAAETYTAEGLRYFLLKQGVVENNSNFSELLALHTINGDLANDIGNCLSRATAKHLNPQQIYPAFNKAFPSLATDADNEYIELVRSLPSIVDKHANSFHFYKCLASITEVARSANLVIQRHELWTFDRVQLEQREHLESLLYCVCEGLRVCGILLQAFVPTLASNLLDRLSVPAQHRTFSDAQRSFSAMDGLNDELAGKRLSNAEMFFKRLKNPLSSRKVGVS